MFLWQAQRRRSFAGEWKKVGGAEEGESLNSLVGDSSSRVARPASLQDIPRPTRNWAYVMSMFGRYVLSTLKQLSLRPRARQPADACEIGPAIGTERDLNTHADWRKVNW